MLELVDLLVGVRLEACFGLTIRDRSGTTGGGFAPPARVLVMPTF